MSDPSAPPAQPVRRTLPGRDLSVRTVAWITVAVFVALTVPQISPTFYKAHFDGDFGVVHLAEAFLLASALGFALVALLRPGTDWPKGARLWLGLIALGLFVLLGEDFEWGQDVFGWETTGWFAQYNDEGETNFHNTSVWLDQYPRAVLYAGMMLGAIVHPLMVRRRGKGIFDKWPDWFVPTLACTPPALGNFVVWLPKLIDKSDLIEGVKLQVGRASERQEVFIYMFMLVYVLSLASRLRSTEKA